MIVLTVGKTYVDIDGYASAIAYRELLKLKKVDACFVINASFNYSITNSLLNLSLGADKYTVKTEDKFIILDLSNKSYFPDFVEEDNIIEIIDHHPGFEDYWKDKLQDKSTIIPIGSVATIIAKKYEEDDLLKDINKDVARLLMAAILDNTLNFTADITTDEDIRIYKELDKIVSDLDFKENYFSECQNYIVNNLTESITKDIKMQNHINILPKVFAQLTIWNVNGLMNKKKLINEIMNSYNSSWMINIISLEENKSYILFSDNEIKNKISYLFNIIEDEDCMIVTPAILRKEIMNISLNNNASK